MYLEIMWLDIPPVSERRETFEVLIPLVGVSVLDLELLFLFYLPRGGN